MIHRTKKYTGVHRKRAWHLLAKIIACFSFLILFAPLCAIPANALGCSGGCDSSNYTFQSNDGSTHTVTCNLCHEQWIENHFCLPPCSNTTCFYCGATSNNGGHFWSYTYVDNSNCRRLCTNCSDNDLLPHDFYMVDETTLSCRHCGFNTVNLPGGNPNFPGLGGLPLDPVGTFQGNNFAWQMYRVICIICVPIAIISLANCGYKFLGAIFFGNYSAPSGGDMQKAQKQFVYTILAVILLILMPRIFGAAISYFRMNAWRP